MQVKVTPEQAARIDAVFTELVELRRDVSLYQFREYVRATHAVNGGNGFLASIGRALVEATTIDLLPVVEAIEKPTDDEARRRDLEAVPGFAWRRE